MSKIVAVTTAVPSNRVTQEEVRDLARLHFAPALPGIERYLSIFRHAKIDTRYFAAPLEWFAEPRSFKDCNDRFIDEAVKLGEETALRCLEQAGLAPCDIQHLFWVSTTGMAAPSPDAMLIQRLGMDRHTRRTPIWGLGCAGGVAGLARAAEYVRAFPDQRAMLICVELCSVTFQWDDRSRRNFVAASLFADGAAAAIVAGNSVALADRGAAVAADEGGTTIDRERPLTLMGTQSTLWPNTLDVMGWNMIDSGMQVVFSPRIPAIVTELMRDNVAELLAAHGLTLGDIDRWVLHPGGARVIDAYEAALEVDAAQVASARSVLRDYGNMSSATIFFVLDAALRQAPLAEGEHALLAVLGPGFSCELALVRG